MNCINFYDLCKQNKYLKKWILWNRTRDSITGFHIYSIYLYLKTNFAELIISVSLPYCPANFWSVPKRCGMSKKIVLWPVKIRHMQARKNNSQPSKRCDICLCRFLVSSCRDCYCDLLTTATVGSCNFWRLSNVGNELDRN